MGNSTRYEVWKLERAEEGIGYRWAIWDNEENRVAKSGVSRGADEAAKDAQFWLGFLTQVYRSTLALNTHLIRG